MSWKEMFLHDIIESNVIGLVKGTKDQSDDFESDYVKMNNITREGRLDLSNYTRVNATLSEIEKYSVEKGDLLFNTRNSTDLVGKSCIYNEDTKRVFNNNLMRIRFKSGVLSNFIQYQLYSPKIRTELNKLINSTTNVAAIYYKNLQYLKLQIPPLATQQKIAAILDAADELRQKDKALVAKYDELTQALFLDMFGDPVTNPKGWEIKTIEEIVSSSKNAIKRGPFGGALKKEIFVEDGYLVYEQFHALNNDFTMARYFIDKNKFNELKGFEVKPGDIIISCSGVYLGKLAIIPEGTREGIINQALLKITLDEQKMRNDFFVFHFTQKNFKEKYFDANRGAGIPNFPPMPTFKKFPFIAPPIKLQNQFAERVKAIEEQKSIAQASALKSVELFNSLLQKAFNGELA